MSNSSSSNNKNHTKKANSSRERDKNKAITSESGGSSQCDTPPLNEKDGSATHGKFAGVGPDSVQCMAEQVGTEINAEAATNLAEDVSYKLRQTISTIALHSEMMKKSRVDTWDVNTVLTLSDTSPVVGACATTYLSFGEDKLCCQVENLVNVTDYAMTTQSYVYSTIPTVSVEWITDEKSLNSNGTISPSLQNYYTKVARAILNLKKNPKKLAVEDLTTNTRIGPIFPNLFNLAVLVLNDDNLTALNVPAKKPLQSNVLDMVDALCSNPCSLDTNIQQQFQRLFPVMVSNILGNGSLAEKMVTILTKITRTWPSFIAIGKSILFEYLSQGSKERLTAPMIKCVAALGRHALVECVGPHLDHVDAALNASAYAHAPAHAHASASASAALRDALLDASTILLRSEPTTYLEDFVITDYSLYEMLGDSIMPRRTLFPITGTLIKENASSEKSADEDFIYAPIRPVVRRPKVKFVSSNIKPKNIIPRDAVFEPTKCSVKCIIVKIKGCRSKEVLSRQRQIRTQNNFSSSRITGVVAASGLLNRFRYRLSKSSDFPIFGALTL